MDPLNEMCSALASINQILEKRKECIEESIQGEINSHLNEGQEHASFSLTTTDMKDNRLTSENFYRARLCNRTIDELPGNSDISSVHRKVVFVLFLFRYKDERD